MSIKELTKAYEEQLPQILKVILQIIPGLGGIIAGVYRILRFIETNTILTLIIGILCIVIPPVGLVFQILDVISQITKNKITILAD